MSLILLVIENLVTGLVLGASTFAVISFFICSKFGYPKSGVGNILIHLFYSVIRMCHVILGIIVLVTLVIFGFLDNSSFIIQAYSVKAFVLVVILIAAILMKERKIDLVIGAPIAASGWYFLASFSSYTTVVGAVPILLNVVIWYLFYIVLAFLFFIITERKFKKEEDE